MNTQGRIRIGKGAGGSGLRLRAQVGMFSSGHLHVDL
jgi:hypothetical protein